MGSEGGGGGRDGGFKAKGRGTAADGAIHRCGDWGTESVLRPDQTPSRWSDTHSGRRTGASGPAGQGKPPLEAVSGDDFTSFRKKDFGEKPEYHSAMFLPWPRSRFVFIIFVGGGLEKSILFPESQTKEGRREGGL